MLSEEYKDELNKSIPEEIIPKRITDTTLSDQNIDTIHYWLYSPGENASKWEEFYQTGIMAIGICFFSKFNK